MCLDDVEYITVKDGDGHYLTLPSLTTMQRDSLTPDNGMMIYNSTTNQVEAYQNGSWGAVGGGGGDVTGPASSTDNAIARFDGTDGKTLQDTSQVTISDAGVITSSVATGTAPLSIASTTVVANLNADKVDGKDETAFLLADGSRALAGNWSLAGYDLADLGTLNFDDATTLTIASGAVTKTQSYHSIDTEGAAATDDLDTINGGTAGDLIYLKAADGTHTVVLKHGTGNIVTPDGNDYSLDDANKAVALIYDSAGTWHLVGSAGGGGSQTPWLSDIDAAGYNLNNLGNLTANEGKDIKVEMAVPTGVSAAAAAGGSLADGTYYYRVTALDGVGETIGSAEVNATTSGTDNSVTISWTAVTGAAKYRVYGRASGAQDQYWETTSTSYTDDGTDGTSGTVPTTTTAYMHKVNASSFYANPSRACFFGDLYLSGYQPKILMRETGDSGILKLIAGPQTWGVANPEEEQPSWVAIEATRGGNGGSVYYGFGSRGYDTSSTAKMYFRFFNQATNTNDNIMIFDPSSNIGLWTTDQFGGGTKVIGIANATTAPTTTPTGGGVLYATNGELHWLGSSGTDTTIAPA